MNHEKQRKLFQASTIVFSKPLYYGGRNFIKYNYLTKKYHTGNTASTAFSSSAGISIEAVTTKEIKQIAQRLANLGYKRHEVKWNTKHDPYEQIQKAGL